MLGFAHTTFWRILCRDIGVHQSIKDQADSRIGPFETTLSQHKNCNLLKIKRIQSVLDRDSTKEVILFYWRLTRINFSYRTTRE